MQRSLYSLSLRFNNYWECLIKWKKGSNYRLRGLNSRYSKIKK